MSEPWNGYDGQTRDERLAQVLTLIGEKLGPALDVLAHWVDYERGHAARQPVIEAANYLLFELALGPGGPDVVPVVDAGDVPPWPAYDTSEPRDLVREAYRQVSGPVLAIRTLLDRVIDYEDAHEKDLTLLSILRWLFARFAFGGGGWVHP